MLPINVEVLGHVIVSSTAELYQIKGDMMQFRLTQPKDEIVLKGLVSVASSDAYCVEQKNRNTYIYSNLDGRINEFLTVGIG